MQRQAILHASAQRRLAGLSRERERAIGRVKKKGKNRGRIELKVTPFLVVMFFFCHKYINQDWYHYHYFSLKLPRVNKNCIVQKRPYQVEVSW